MSVRLHRIPFTTDPAGAATLHSRAFTGFFVALYVDVGSGGTALAAGTDIVITEEATGAALVTLTNAGSASARYQPRSPVHDEAGAALAGAYDSAPVSGPIKAVVAQGGNTKSGALTLYVDEG